MTLLLLIQANFRGYRDSGGPPLSLAHAFSPKMNALFGVERSQLPERSTAKVSITSGPGPACGRNAESTVLFAPLAASSSLSRPSELPLVPGVTRRLTSADAEAESCLPLSFLWADETESRIVPNSIVATKAKINRAAFVSDRF